MRNSKIFKDFANLLNQDYCYLCGKIEEIICIECIFKLLESSKLQYLEDIPVLSLTLNNENITRLIISFKDKGVTNLKDPFSKMISLGLKYFSQHQNLNIVSVPSSDAAIQKRGLDPISLLTSDSCERAGKRFQYEKGLLINAGKRLDQAGLNQKQRGQNMAHAFKVGKESSKPVLIVDDLITTGSTLLACIEALRQKSIPIKACVALAANQ